MKALKEQKPAISHKELRKNLFFYLLPIPGIICLILFSYLPMAGLYVVFERYTYQGGLFGSEFVGLQNFKFFFRSIDDALRATRNTLIINGFNIIFGTVVNVSLAIAINEIGNKWFRKITQSVMLFPHFISWIVVGMIPSLCSMKARGFSIILSRPLEAKRCHGIPMRRSGGRYSS